MEVFAGDWENDGQGKPSRVAIKRISRQYVPTRNKDIPVEKDSICLQERSVFYSRVEDMTQKLESWQG